MGVFQYLSERFGVLPLRMVERLLVVKAHAAEWMP